MAGQYHLPPTPDGYRSLTVTHQTVRVGDRVRRGTSWVTVTDLRARGGLRDVVVLILATGRPLPLHDGDRVTVLRPVAAQTEQAR